MLAASTDDPVAGPEAPAAGPPLYVLANPGSGANDKSQARETLERVFGQAGREPMTVDVGSMMGGNRSLSGVFLGAEIGTERVQKNIERLIADVAKGELKVLIDREFPLSQAAEAHRYIESRQAVGRVLLIP